MIFGFLAKACIFCTILGLLMVPVYCYIIYPLLLAVLPRGRYADPPMPQPGEPQPMVSVIIAAFNEDQHIAQRIQNCLGSSYPADRLEVLVGSDGSDDETNKILSSFKDPRVRAFPFTERRGKVSVLNDLAREATGEILVFSDANTAFNDDNIACLVQRFNAREVACVCGKLVFVDPETGTPPNNEGAYWKLETFLKTAEGSRGALLGANGANFAIRASYFIECPINTLVEDFLMPMLVLKQGGKVVYAPEALATEDSAPSTKDEFRRRVRIGAGAFQSLTQLWPLLSPSRGFAAFAFFSHKVLRWLTPFLVLGAFLITLTMSFLCGGIFWGALLLQLGLLGLIVIGWFAEKFRLRIGLLGLPFYFFSMNAALFVGFFRWVGSAQKVTWTRTPRATAKIS